MAVVELNYGRIREHFRDYRRVIQQLLAGPALWLLFLGAGLWALLTRTDTFAVGVVTGSIFALGAIGLTLVYGILRFAHFAHGDMMMMAAYLAFFLLTGTGIGERADTEVLPAALNDLPGAGSPILEFSFGYGLLLGLALSAVLIAAVLVAMDRLVYRRLRARRSGIVIFAIASLGIALATRSLILIVWGPDPRFYTRGFRESFTLPFDVRLLYDQLFILIAAVVLVALVYALLFRTRLGKSMRATADNPDLALVSGINTDRVIMWTWIIGGTLVAAAGVMLALQAQLDPNLGFVVLLPLFAAAILGGIGSPQGALVGGMIVGIAQEVAVTLGFLAPGYKFSVAFVILILILLVRPRGLFGGRT